MLSRDLALRLSVACSASGALVSDFLDIECNLKNSTTAKMTAAAHHATCLHIHGFPLRWRGLKVGLDLACLMPACGGDILPWRMPSHPPAHAQ
jgi:hypothetical protein